MLPQRLATYAVRRECASGRAVPVNRSLLAHFERLLRPLLQLGLTVRDAMALEVSFLTQLEALPYSMWVLSGLLGFVRLQGFTQADSALFNQLVTALSKSLAHQTQVSASHTSFSCHHCRREFYLSHLPAYFSDVTKRYMLSSPAVFADSLFCEEDVVRLLEATRSLSSLKSQQAMVDVASRRSSAPASRQRRSSLGRSPHRVLGGMGILGRRTVGHSGSQGSLHSTFRFPSSSVIYTYPPSKLLPLLRSEVSSRCISKRLVVQGCN